MADLGEIQAAVAHEDESVAVPIYQRNGDPYLGADGEQATISVVGSESKTYHRERQKQRRRMLKQRKTTLDVEDLDRDRLDLAAACVTGWAGWEMGGQPFPFSPENARRLLAVEHILEQVERGIDRHADFFASNSRD